MSASGLDEAALAEWMAANVDGFRGPLTLERFKGGQSNPTYKVTTPDRAYALRRKPSGQLLKGAHAVDREARVMGALNSAGFPAPRIYGLCTDDAVIGAWFYVMELVEGRIIWDATFPGLTNAQRAAHFDAMNDTLARLHGLGYAAAGLEGFGRPDAYLQRQIARWSKQYLEDTDAGRDPNMDRLIAWLPERIPAGDETAVVHGDFRCDNLIFHPSEPRIIAVLDWELATLGHPAVDFAYHAMMYRMPPDIVAGLAGADLEALGIPLEADYLAAYCARTGRASLPDYEFHMVFNLFRMAAIFHGIKGRAVRGTASSDEAAEHAANFPRLAQLAWDSAVASGL